MGEKNEGSRQSFGEYVSGFLEDSVGKTNLRTREIKDKIKIYHGSDHELRNPSLRQGKATSDYGKGFYCTQSLELAKEWSCRDAKSDGKANEYELDCEGLKVAFFGEDEESVLAWLSVLIEHRVIDADATQKKRIQTIKDNWPIRLAGIDIAIGYRADDSYFSFVRGFLDGWLSLEDLMNIMHLGCLGKQIVLLSEKAFHCLSFVRAMNAEAKIYYPRRKAREAKACRNYQEEAFLKMRKNPHQIYAIDIVRWAEERKEEPGKGYGGESGKEDFEL